MDVKGSDGHKTRSVTESRRGTYNFIKIHSTLRMTPAMAAGVTTRLYDVADLVNLLIEAESKKRRRI